MYGLIISLFIIPWKCFLMSTDSTIIGQYVGVDMVLLCHGFTIIMTFLLLGMSYPFIYKWTDGSIKYDLQWWSISNKMLVHQK